MESSRKRRILVVDDDRDCLAAVAASLHGYEVLALSCGAGLAARASEFGAELLVLDVNLGAEDGRELCRALKGLCATSAIPIVFLSGRADTEDFLSAFRAGAAAYVTKPLDPGDLRRLVSDLLGRRVEDGAPGPPAARPEPPPPA